MESGIAGRGEHTSRRGGRRRDWLWGALCALLALAAVRGVFSLSSVFYVRDLAYGFWPEHLWFDSIVASGDSFLWDPYLSFGQSAVADPTRHLFFPPVALARLLLPRIVAFNVTVALPYPVAALGMFVFLRRHVTGAAASLGAVVFALSGPVLSTGNFPNMAWAVAIAPYLLASVDRLGERPDPRRFAALAALFALDLLAAEPVTLLTNATLVTAYGAFGTPTPRGSRARSRTALLVVGAGAAGFLLSAVQGFPLISGFLLSARETGVADATRVIGSVHPISLVELVAPFLFGDPIRTYFSPSQWIGALNKGYEPIIYSLYVGIAPLALGALGFAIAPARRWAIFWAAVFCIALVLALGVYTPAYPALVRLPVVRSFRFPVKFSVQGMMALGALAAAGWDALGAGSARRRAEWAGLLPAALVGLVALAVVALLASGPPATATFAALAAYLDIRNVDTAAAQLGTALWIQAPRLAGLSAATATFMLAAAARPQAARLCQALLFAMVAADLLVSNSALNPTAGADVLAQPAWVAAARTCPHDRVYVGPHMTPALPEDTRVWKAGPPVSELSDAVVRSRQSTDYVWFPSAYRLRDTLTGDATAMWSGQYQYFQRAFAERPAEDRFRYLRRVGTRYFLLPYAPPGDVQLVEKVPGYDQLSLFESRPEVSRATVVTRARVEADLHAQTDLMFSQDFDPSVEVLLAAEPPAPAATSAASGPVAAAADLVDDSPSRVVVHARVPAPDGFLVLSDTYDPYWSATVDGAPAAVLRANGLFRAVRLGAGEHEVRFEYHPRPFYAGVTVTILTALALAGACARAPRAVPTGDKCLEFS